jgi:hypothetical protein
LAAHDARIDEILKPRTYNPLFRLADQGEKIHLRTPSLSGAATE